MNTILFVGDSITDAGRNLNDDNFMGYGYVTMTAGKIGCDYPGKYRCVNRGINGNKAVDIFARVKRDVINLNPNIVVILCGVNDVWHELDYKDGSSIQKFEQIYEALICEIKAVLPEVQIVIMEPYVLMGIGTEQYYSVFRSEIEQRAKITKKISDKFKFNYVPIQVILDRFATEFSSNEILLDGVHPTCTGHELISRTLYNELKKIL